MNTPKKIYLIRHGQTDYNKNGIIQGSKINASLNEEGRSQAKLFFDAYQSVPFEIVFTSTLKRSKESVQQFLDKGIAWEECSGLNEISWGDYDGKKIEVGDYYWQIVDQWKKGDVEVAAHNGESPKDVAERQKSVIEKIKKAETSNLLICMHGRAMRILLCQLLNKPLVKMDDFKHHNLGLYLLDFDGEEFSMVEKNNISHLK